jgi:hypothetical protein
VLRPHVIEGPAKQPCDRFGISNPEQWRHAAASAAFGAIVVLVLRPALRRADLPACAF